MSLAVLHQTWRLIADNKSTSASQASVTSGSRYAYSHGGHDGFKYRGEKIASTHCWLTLSAPGSP